MAEKSLLEGKKILVVDDETDVLEILEELLSMCKVVKAATFEEAKALLEAEDFDMAVLDIMGVDGYALLDIAKRRKIPAAMLTAHAFTPKNLVRSIKKGAVSYIPKEEISNIVGFLEDIFKAKNEGRSTWEPWQERLPSSYFEKRWGAAWRDTEDEFWTRFKASVRAKRDASH
ncbi:MAG: response regulator [Deltaproteobacteria bacterium]